MDLFSRRSRTQQINVILRESSPRQRARRFERALVTPENASNSFHTLDRCTLISMQCFSPLCSSLAQPRGGRDPYVRIVTLPLGFRFSAVSCL